MGLNHLTWTRRVLVDGVDVLPDLLERGHELLTPSGLPLDLLRRLGVWPSYYLRYYYAHDAVVAEQKAAPSRAAEVAAIERQLLDLYADPALDEKPALLEQRGGAYYSEAAVNLVASLVADRGRRAGGQPPQQRHPAVPRRQRCDRGARPGRRRRGRPPCRSSRSTRCSPDWSRMSSAYEQLALDAAVHGGRDRVYRALLAHPLIGQHDVAARLTDLLLDANRDHLRWLA